MESASSQLTLNQIYAWFEANFAFYRYNTSSWKVGVLTSSPSNIFFQLSPFNSLWPGPVPYWCHALVVGHFACVEIQTKEYPFIYVQYAYERSQC